MKKLKIKKILLLIVILVASSYGAFILISDMTKKEDVKKPVEVINEIKSYGYTLDENEIKPYKDLFKQLKEELEKDEIDEEKYASYIASLFAYDFYNLDNKLTNSDIGGVQFIHNDAKDNFILKAQDTIYKYVESNINGERIQKLPVVKNVEVDGVYIESYSYGKTKDSNALKVILKIEYEVDYGYPEDVTIYLVHEDSKKLSIVEIN